MSEKKPPRPLLETLNVLRVGDRMLLDVAADKLQEATLAADRTGKAASITIKITLRRATKATLGVSSEVTSKIPAGEKHEALLFPTPEGNLSRDDPAQTKLDLRVADAPMRDGELKTAN